MPLLRDDLLAPLSGGSKGENLRNAPVYDKIKEARLEDEDDAPQGEWQRQRKKADFATVLKLAGDALANKSKDLQLAVWLSEAVIRREGFAALPECIKLLHDLQDRFWDVLYPELDDGSPDFRATPQEWFSARCDYLLRRVPLTKKGLDWLRYKESRTVGYEESSGNDDEKKAKREEAIAEGKITGEEFDEAFDDTPKKFYGSAHADLEAAQAALAALESFCEEKYGNVAPNFSKLRNILEEIKQTVGILLRKKRELEPDELPALEAQSVAAEETASDVSPATDRPPSVTSPAFLQVANPGNQEEAFAMVGRLAEHLRKQDSSAVSPYLMTRAVRWGELRSAGDDPDPALLAAPSSELRQTLKRLYVENKWPELLACVEAAVITPCGRAWLDPHRYAWHACNELGFSAAAKAICSGVKALLADFPSLSSWVLTDDTLVANTETKTWLEEYVVGPPQGETGAQIVQLAAPSSAESHENGTVDPFEVAKQLAQNGRLLEAMDILTRQHSHEKSGRERFLRQIQISQLCLSTGKSAVAYPILQDLFSEIKTRALLDWESTSFVVYPLTLLVQCIDQTGQDAQERSQIYNLLCRLEPSVALQLQRS